MRPKKQILVIDDDSEMRSLLSDFLKTQGYSVITAPSGAAALPMVLQPENPPPDLVISDIQMQPINGVDLLRKIRSARPMLPVVMISAFAERDREKEVISMGAKKFLAKPFLLRELARVVQQTLQTV